MGFVRNIWDGLLSLLAAVASVAICAVPTWYTHVAAQAGLAPQWAYVAVVGLIFVGGVMVVAFLRKAAAGVAPLRERRRS